MNFYFQPNTQKKCNYCDKWAVNLQEHDGDWYHPLCWNMIRRGEQYR